MKNIILILICSISISVSGQSKDGGQELIDKFFQIYIDKGSDEALDYLFETNEWMETRTEGIQNVKFEVAKNISLIGEYIENEEIKSRQIGSRFRIVSYFVYYERQPLRFTFELYKNQKGWLLWNFAFDTDYDDEIEESMKLYNFKELSDW